MQVQERLYTIDDLNRIANLPENSEKRFELIEGVIYDVNPPRPYHAYVSGLFYAYLFAFVAAHDLGFVFPDAVGYRLSQTTLLIPDASFVGKAKLPGFPLPDELDFAPDFAIEVAVEVIGKPDSILAVQRKAKRYLTYGTRIVWVVYPYEQFIEVYTLLEDGGVRVKKFDLDSTLDGGDVLSGFTLAVRQVFPK
jgi:Uma2 family endonuclease